MKINSMFSVLLGIVALVFAGCESSSEGESAITLDTYELNVDGGGGDIPLYYFVTNPKKGGKFDIVCTESWVSLKEVTSKTIVLHIDASDSSDERFAMVTIKYPGAESAKVMVLQDKQLLNKFSFAVSNVTYKSCTVSYKPLDKNRPYMANIIDAEYFKQSGVGQDIAFVDKEMESYLALAQRNNMTLEELMGRVSPQLIYTGDAERQFVGMQPGASYVIYSYGIDFSGNSYTMTTPMHSTIVELPMPEMYDVSFNINCNMSGNTATINIDPGDWSGYYSVQIAPDDSLHYIEPGTPMGEGAIKNLANKFYTNARNAMKAGSSAEQYLRSNCYTGFRSLDVQSQSGKKYMIIVFAVESKDGEVPVMRSMPSFYYI
ncbi:MAG: BACON domain-containing protein [Alistipes sp.]|nr:BACON domain-containing protein [Alistipes sp.]